MHHDDIRRPHDACDRRDVTDEVEIELVVESRVDRVRRTDHEEGIAVRRRTHAHFGADIGTCARSVFYDELLAESLREPLTDQARHDVGRTAGGKGATTRTGRVGYACAFAIRDTAGSAAAPAARCRNCRRGSFMSLRTYASTVMNS